MLKKTFIFLFSIILFAGCAKKITQTKVLVDLKELSDDKYEGRKTGTKGNELAAEMIINRFKNLDLSSYYSDFKQPVTFKNEDNKTINGHNIIAYIKGKSEKTIVISAHYDHLGIRDGKIFNGADDNASGVCAVLAFAEYFAKHQPDHTLIFAIFDAEEMGLQGSKYFVSHLPLPINDVVLNINMDMISHNDKNELYASGTYHFPTLKTFIYSKAVNPKILFGHDDPKLGADDWTMQSDHASFFEKKIPFIYFGVEDHKDYHKETDEFKNINQEFYVNAVDAILNVVKNFDKDFSLQKTLRGNQIMK